MLVRDAKQVAQQWVRAEASRQPDLYGAFVSGSTSTMPDDAPLPAASDVDVKLVWDRPAVPLDPQKFRYRGVILEISDAARADFASAEAVLANYHTAVHFTHPALLLDPTGHLTAIQPIVAREYARRYWVQRRCEHARTSLLTSLTWLTPTAPLHDQVFTLLYAVLMTAHIVLVTDLRNPTVRKSLVGSGQILARYGHAPLHERVLAILGSAALDRPQVESLLAACAEVFDIAQAIWTTPFPYASNVSACARPIAIGGTQELISAGFPREAVLWLGAIHTWAQTALSLDAPEAVQCRCTPVYERLLEALGVPTSKAVAERVGQIRDLLPELWQVAEEIIATNPALQE